MTPSSASERSEGSPAIDAAARRDLYALCARILASEIDAELLRRLCSAELAASGLTLVDDDLRALDEATALDELAAEYCRLFVGPQPVAAPYASVQRGEVLLGGRSRARLLELMDKHGLEVETGISIASPDHAAVMVALLATLYAEAAGATEPAEAASAISAARELLTGCVLPWMPAYLDRLADVASREPYRSVSMLLAALLDQEREELERSH